MSTDDDEGWLADTRDSYDTDASGYAEKVRGLLGERPYLRTSLALFAELVREAGGGPVADVSHGPQHTSEGYTGRPINVDSHHRPPGQVAGWLRDAGFTIEAEMVFRPDDSVPGAIIFARSPA
ncbi:hypothetical protein [Solicola gregarius]|uniref:SAM-dependent methyltransferase n=1 Tax=Solicola gregarius TaxID=2908642 RepID=A0AA46TMH5_9ACTN|nr:hypothetical protein [Solicola gregarius]UYM07652.1 hypothetical protein L0C25_11450 [Solicola gregarius]